MSEPREGLTAAGLPGLLRSVLAALARRRDEIDALNVFPVPDGDTGTNLVQTVQAAVDAIDRTDDLRAMAHAAGRGALRGAVGNSGVIFSQVIRALAEVLDDEPMTTSDLAAFLQRSRDLAYEAVAEPAPGTILSAMDAAARAAHAAAARHDRLDLALAAVAAAVADAVGESRDVLEANRAAGVVDAGARGFEVALEGLRAFVDGRELPPAPPPPVRRVDGPVVPRESGSLAYAFEVQYLLEAPDEVAEGLRMDLELLGDSVVVVACGGLLNVHVHTNDIGAALEAGLDRGRPSRVEVTSFADQIAGRASGAPADRLEPGAHHDERAKVGYVAVLPGPGLRQLASELGAVPVAGTAGALPNVADLLNAIGQVGATEVVVLPGNPNVVPTARQASEVSVAEGGRPVHVVENAVTVPAVLAALAVATADTLDLDALVATAGDVRAGEVVTAVRDAETPLGTVRRGQYLAVVAGSVVAACDTPLEALQALADRLDAPGAEVLTLIAGADVDPDERGEITAWLRSRCNGADIDVVDGRQRPARWIVGIEG